MNDGSKLAVHHILKDGSDSIGVAGASLRVFVNEGMCVDEWVKHHELLEGKTQQSPVSREVLYKSCKAYRDTAARMDDAADFLQTQGTLHLEDAPGGDQFLTRDAAVLEKGKIVFADKCASCHSSKQRSADIVGEDARRRCDEAGTIYLDYSQSDFAVVRGVQDYIRRIDDRLYIGKAFITLPGMKTRALACYFALDFAR
jgi:hypothetical protein